MSRDKFENGILIFTFSHVLLGIFLAITNSQYFKSIYTIEDGAIEWFTADALIFITCLSLYRAYTLRKSKKPFFTFCLISLAIITLFGAGEELSWGQRLLNIKSTAYFAKNNAQGEMNLHNLVVGGKKINKLIFGTGLGLVMVFYFLIAPWLYKSKKKFKDLIDSMAIPIPKTKHIIAYITLAIIVSLTPSGKKGELLEFGGVCIFTALFLNPFNIHIYLKEN